ncbi:MAG: DNA polymerase III subunit delta [Thermoleophilia bacterium]|nr:DNA polymerase III subunit delta [Thermoleophilia bacterium]
MSARPKKKNRLKPVYLITGTDTPKVETAARRLRDRVSEDSGTDINIDIFDALDHSAGHVIQAASTLPFGEGVRLVMAMNIGAWNKPDKDELAAFLACPPEYACIALVGAGLRKTEGLYRAVEAAGEVLVFTAPTPANFPRWTQEQAEIRGLKLGAGEARRLVALSGPDQRAIAIELDKLAAYAGRGAVEMEDIEALCWVSPEARIWDLTDALGTRNREAVFRHLERLLADGTAPASVFFSLAKHLKQLSQVVAARERGEEAAASAAALGLKPFPAKKIAGQSRNFTGSGVRRAIAVFSDLDADMKGRSELRPDFALELAICRVLDIV